jgi:hypothetical protein
VVAFGSRPAAYTFTIRPVTSRLKAAMKAIKTVLKNFLGLNGWS